MRLFAALVPPDDVVDRLAGTVAELRRLPGADGLRWTGRPGWHLTLAFYGEVDAGTVPELSDRLGRAAGRTPAFSLALRGGGRFGRGSALWAGADGDLRTLRLLASRAEAAARKAGVPMGEHRPYTAHLTVARGRGRHTVDVRPWVRALQDFSSRPWTVDELLLVSSRPPGAGVPGAQPSYETVGRWPLNGAR